MGRFKAGLNGKGWVDSVTINVSTEITYRCIYVFKMYVCILHACI